MKYNKNNVFNITDSFINMYNKIHSKHCACVHVGEVLPN